MNNFKKIIFKLELSIVAANGMTLFCANTSTDTVMTKFGTATWRVNKLRSIQIGRHFPDDIFKFIFFNENVSLAIIISLKFVPKGPINSFGSDDGLAPARWQAIICTNADPIHWCIYAALEGDELRQL